MDQDSSFLRRHLTHKLATALNLLEYERKNGETVVSEVSNEDGGEKVKETLISNIGINSIPTIEAKETTVNNEPILNHVFDQRDLQINYTEFHRTKMCGKKRTFSKFETLKKESIK